MWLFSSNLGAEAVTEVKRCLPIMRDRILVRGRHSPLGAG